MASTDLRTAAQQALEALEQIAILAEYGTTGPGKCQSRALNERQATSLRLSVSDLSRAQITVLRAALAEPVQEPVAIMTVREDMGADFKFNRAHTLEPGQQFYLLGSLPMDDRTLLENAAKAAGMTLEWGGKYKLGEDEIDCTDIPYIRSGQPDEGDVHWNPLTDDGDALRLAVKLNMQIVITGYELEGVGITDCKAFSGKWAGGLLHHNDPYAATRRAIVRAAAEIGRST